MSARHWDRRTHQTRNWWASHKLDDYVQAQIAGESEAPAEGGVARAIRKRVGGRTLARGVSVGCGLARKEMALLASGVVAELDLFEISESRIAEGRRELGRRGLAGRASYFAADALSWPAEDLYDLVTWDHSLHHMSDVRAALEWSRRAVAPGGVIAINDYIGPNRLQWTPHDARLANEFFAACEARYGLRLPRVAPGGPLSRLRTIMKDPSEAPESELIEQASRDVLGLELRPIGGALLNVAALSLLSCCDDDHPALDDMIRWDSEARERGHSHFAVGFWMKPGEPVTV